MNSVKLFPVLIKLFNIEDKEIDLPNFEPFQKIFDKITDVFTKSGNKKWTFKIFPSTEQSVKITPLTTETIFTIRTQKYFQDYLGFEMTTEEKEAQVHCLDETDLQVFADQIAQAIPSPSFPSKAPIEPSKNVFTSGVYPYYREELQQKLDQLALKYPESQQEILRLKQLLTSADFVKAHSLFLGEFRSIIRKDSPMTLELSEWMFTEPSLEHLWWDVLVSYMPSLKQMEEINLAHLHHIFDHLKRHPKLSGAENLMVTDYHLRGNFPAPLWKDENTQFMRSH